jgi:tetratricopeptide (TPR) repeat protein
MIAHLNRGVCYYKAGDPDRAMMDWDSVRANYPNQPTLAYVYSVASNYYYGQGLKYGKAGDHEKAIIAFTKGADAAPKDADIWFNIGFANLSLSHYSEAAKAFERSLQLKPGNPRAQAYLDQARGHIIGLTTDSLRK